MNYTIEDYIFAMAGMQKHKDAWPEFKIDTSDVNLIMSFARQLARKIGFTDRQFALAQKKILEYKDQFDKFEIDLDGIEKTSLPIREIDRSRWIKIIDEDYFGVRFPFSKKMIKHIEFLSTVEDRTRYDKQGKVHYIPITEKNIFSVVENLPDVFELDDSISEIYRNIQMMKNDKENNAPGIYSFKLKNLHKKAFDYAISSIGEPTVENLVLYKDKEDVLGITHIDEDDLAHSLNFMQPLTARIVKRSKPNVFVSSKEFNLNNIAETLLELHRFPILFVIPEKGSLDCVHDAQDSFRNIIDNSSISNLHRKDNTSQENTEYNQYIKREKINNSLDQNTKIVYISNNKIPKPLLESNWSPSVAVVFGSMQAGMRSGVNEYLNDIDLVIYFDDDISYFTRNKIEKI